MEKLYSSSYYYQRLIANRYRLESLICRGGMGDIYLANDTLLGGVPVAIKLISRAISDNKIHQEFADEARICAALSQRSINIVKVTDYGVSDCGDAYYVMEYLQGQNLGDLGLLSLHRFINIARQICLGLQCAHEGVNLNGKKYTLVHQDIKPANILVTSDYILGELVKIIDFGVAKLINISSSVKNSCGFQGTLPYCSPEQLDGSKIDYRSDIYSLGVVMYEMLVGEKPWKPETDYFGAWFRVHLYEAPRLMLEVNPNLEIPQDLQSLILACLSKNPSHRPQNVAEIIKVLEGIKAGNVQTKINSHVPQPSSEPVIIPSNTGSSVASGLNISLEKACWQSAWSKHKPIREIVFPHLLETEQETVAALSLMMPKEEIKKCKFIARYNEFVFIRKPYPVLLWLTLLYSREQGAKWLPCYLDMYNSSHCDIVRCLSDNESYPIILFALEPPYQCTNVCSGHIEIRQQQKLKAWLKLSESLPHVSSSGFELSKKLLQQHYQLIRKRIVLEAVFAN